jgi:hypothetical protein
MRQKTDRLRKMKRNGYYPSKKALDIGNIYDCDFDLASDFLIYYFLFTDDNIRDEVEMEVSEPELAQMEEVVVEPVEVVVEAMVEPVVESAPESVVESVSEILSESMPEPVVETSSYDSGSSYDGGGCDSGGGDCGGCD